MSQNPFEALQDKMKHRCELIKRIGKNPDCVVLDIAQIWIACLLEMPTGTGKTVCLLSLITSYQFANPSAGKLVYCTRTVPEMNSVMEELATVLTYHAEQLKHDNHETVDMEDSTTQQQNQGEDTTESPSVQKKARRVYSGKNKNAEPPMGPIVRDGGAGGSGVLALCLSSR
jgi:Rad3-related DNA helicase